MAKYLNLPDGSSVEIKNGETREQALARAFDKYPEAFGFGKPADTAAKQPESGFVPALKAGTSELKSGLAALAGRTGIMDQGAAEQYIAEQQKYQQETFKPTETFSEAPFTKFKELLGGSIPYMAAPLVVGGAAATAPVSAPAATALGMLGAGAASATQFTGSNLRRQMDEGKALGDTELGAAALAAVPQAALDTLSFRMIPGIRQILTAAGKEVTPQMAKKIAEQSAKEIIKDYGLATGKAMGTEGLTEVGQQVLERFQAGLDLADPQARNEYYDSLIGGVVLGGALAPAGRYVERRGQAGKEEQQRLDEAMKLRSDEEAAKAKLQAEEQAKRTTPEWQDSFVAGYEQRLARLKEIKATPKPGKDADPMAVVAYKDLQKERQELDKALKTEAKDYTEAKKAVAQRQAALTQEQNAEYERRQAEMEAVDTETQSEPYYEQPQLGLPGFGNAPAQESEAQQPEFVDYASQVRNLEDSLDEIRTRAQQTTTLADKLALNEQYAQFSTALQEAQRLQKEQAAQQPKSEDSKVKTLLKKMAQAEESGDVPAQAKIAQQLQALGVTDTAQVNLTPAQAEMPMVPFKTKVSTKAEYAAQVYKPGPLDIESQEQDYLEQAERDRQQATADAERERKITPEVLALRRIQGNDNPAAAEGVKREGQISGLVDKLVNGVLKSDGTAPGRVVTGTNPSDISEVETLRAQLAYATAVDDRVRANNVREQLKALNEPVTDKTQDDLSFGERARKSGIEGRLSGDAMQANRVTRLSSAQLTAFDRLADFVQSVREGDQNDAEAKKETLRGAAERLKDTVVGLALQEADARRAQAGLPAMDAQRQTAMVGRMNKVLNELISRGASLFKPELDSASTRSGKLVRGQGQGADAQNAGRVNTPFDEKVSSAQTAYEQSQKELAQAIDAMNRRVAEARAEAADSNKDPKILEQTLTYDPVVRAGEAAQRKLRELRSTWANLLNQRNQYLQRSTASNGQQPGFFNNFTAAANSLRAQMRSVLDEVGEIKAPDAKKPEPRKARKVDDVLRMTFQGQERSTKDQFAAAYDRSASDEDYRTLKEMEKLLPSMSEEGKALALEQVRRVETGQALDIPPQLKQELADVRKAGQTDTLAQAEMFTGDDERGSFRTTTNRFINFLNSGKVQEMRAAVAEAQKVAAFQAKRAATIQRKIEEDAKKQQDMLDKMAAAAKRDPVEAARDSLKKTVGRYQASVLLADEIVKQRNKARIAVAQQVIELENAHNEVKKQADEIEALYDYAVKNYLNKPRSPKTEAELAYFEQQRDKAAAELEASQKALDEGKAAQTKLLESFASDTVDNALLNEGAKAQRKIDRAEQAVKDAQNKEAEAKRQLTATRRDKPAAPVVESQKYDTVRVYRDTSDSSVQTRVAYLRMKIGKAERDHEVAQAAGNKPAMEKALGNIEKAYDEIYTTLNEAPLRRETRMSDEQVRAQEKFDEAQDDVFKSTQSAFEQATGQKLKMKQRRTLEAVKDQRTGRVITPVKQDSVAVQERKFKQENASGDYKARALEELAKARAELAEVQAQIAFIDDNKAAPRTPAAARQKAARTAAVAKRTALEAKIKNLNVAQREVVQDAKVERQAEKALRKEGKEVLATGMIAPSRSQTAVDASELEDEVGPALFRTTQPAGRGVDPDELVRFTTRVTEKWKNVPNMVVARDFDALPENIKQQALRDGVQDAIPGVYDPNSNTMYLVATNVGSPEDALATIAHEVAGHFGIRSILGANYGATMDAIFNGNKSVREKAQAKMDENPSLSQQIATEEVLADMSEQTPEAKSALRQIYDAIKAWFKRVFGETVSDKAVAQIVANARKYVIEGGDAGKGGIDKRGIVYRVDATYANPEMQKFGNSVDKVVAKQRSFWEKVKVNTSGMAFATQLVDRFAGFERLAKYMEPLKGTQMLYYMRMYDQRMNFTSQAVGNGAPRLVEKARPDGRKEFVLEAKEGANLKNVVSILSEAQPMVGNAEAVNRAFTMYLAALRADRVGLAALNFGEDVNQQMLDDAKALVARTPGLKAVFDKARDEYNAYNRDMMKFLADSGALSESVANKLAATNDYIPFYRQQDGNAMLFISGENPIKIGSIADQPYLQELVGGDETILDFLTSSVQNTNMLVDMGLRNLATKNAVFELINLNAAKIVKGRPSGADVVKFKVDGEDRYAVLDTETVTVGGKRFDTGVPAELLVKGMEGIPVQMPALLRLVAAPAQLLRKAVTLSPVYMAKQLFRDSLAAPILSGADFTPVAGALRQLRGSAKKTLESRGITGGQYMNGTNEDMTKILRDLSDGKPGWMVGLARLEALGMEADALTRRAQYNSYINQGMSEMEATLMALESMNFNKRGASPSIHMANAMIPFLNAQIQGLNVLYKAFTGNMPFNDKLKLRQKLLLRGTMLAGATLIYAAMMEDDEAYKNAKPEEKYGNWFVRVPGLDEPVRIPIPFEIGYIFKALPEALYNTMTTQDGGKDAVKAFRQILLNTVPGGSSYGIPQALKPAIEAGLGKSFYTGRDILSAREKELLPEEQFRANTAEVSKILGKELGVSPIIFENLVRGYTGTLGTAFLHALSLGAPKSESPEAAVKRLSEYPLIGGTFQPNDSGGILNTMYERFNEDMAVRNSFKKAIAEGRTAEANDLLQRRGNEIMEAEIGDVFKQNMSKLTQAERAIAASSMTPEEKRRQLDEIRRIKTGIARSIRGVVEKTTPQ